MSVEIRTGLDEITCYFHELEDPRSEVNRLHPLDGVIVIAIMGILAGAKGPTGIATWANLNEAFLKSNLNLPNGVPQKDVFRRVLATLKPGAFQVCFANWLTALKTKAAAASDVDQPIYAVDGKTLRRSHDKSKGLGALHSVSVWASDFGLSLGQVATDQKSNEITAIPELLKLVDIRGATITIDAMGTQTAIAEEIIAGEADYVLALKGNQESLFNAVTEHFSEALENDSVDPGLCQHTTNEKGHGRKETRHYFQMPAPKTLPGFGRWKGLLTIGMVISTVVRNGKETGAIRYYISSLDMGIKRFAHAVRAHWGIENTCHWTLDVTYREDDSRIRNEHLRENIAWLNRFTLSLLKQYDDKQSVAMRRQTCGWNPEYLLATLVGSKA